MITKTAQAIAYFKDGEYKKALSIFKTFKMQLTKEEQRVIQIGYEHLTGHSDFYRQIGIDSKLMYEKSLSIITDRFLETPHCNKKYLQNKYL